VDRGWEQRAEGRVGRVRGGRDEMGRHTATTRRLSMSVTPVETDAALFGGVGVEVALSLCIHNN